MEQVANLSAEDRAKFDEEFFAPPAGRDPDKVTQGTVDEEMSMFMALAGQNSSK